MKPKITLYGFLSFVAILAVPVAPVFFFGWRVYEEVSRKAGPLLGGLVGLFSAIGLEIVGVLAGHLATEFWKTGKTSRAVLAAAIMGIYVVIGVYELRGTIGAVMFVIAPLVYVLVGLQYIASDEKTQEQRQDNRKQVIDYREREAAAQRQHELDMERLRLDADVKKEKLRQPKVVAAAQPVNYHVSTVNHPSTIDELTPSQRKVYDAMMDNPDKNQAEIADLLGVTRQAVSKHVKVINGLASRPQLVQGGE
jgi:DNA-binding CsgD family transcriptional regulator